MKINIKSLILILTLALAVVGQSDLPELGTLDGLKVKQSSISQRTHSSPN